MEKDKENGDRDQSSESNQEAQGPSCGVENVADMTQERLLDLLKKAKEREDFLERLRCLQAENENYRKRVAREASRNRLWGIRDTVQALLPVLDNLERAMKAQAGSAGCDSALRDGVALVLVHAREALARVGVKQIETAGKCFDPAWHESLAEVDAPGSKPYAIVEEVEKGYILEDLVVRPARVVIAKARAKPKAGSEAEPPTSKGSGPSCEDA